MLESERKNVVYWWIDTTFAVHHDLWSHTGGMLTMGTGAIYAFSKKKKLNTKSSTEVE